MRAELAALTNWARAARPVFVVGPARSGTSMLQLALRRHSALFAVGGVFETFLFHKPKAPLEDPVPGMLRNYLKGAPGVAAVRAAVAAIEAGAEPLGNDDLIRVFFQVAQQQLYEGRRPLEKTPAHVHNLPAIFRIFPQARVLACVREPVEILSSYRQRLAREQAAGKPPETWAWLTVDDDNLLAQLRRVKKALQTAESDFPGQVFQVPYGWITAEPEVALRQICAFVNEAFEPAMLDAEQAMDRKVDPRLARPIAPSEVTPASVLGAEAAARFVASTPYMSAAWRRIGPLSAAGQS